MPMDYKETIALMNSLTYVKNNYDMFIRKFLKQMAMRAMAKTKLLTPVITGDLRDRWEVGDVLRVGDEFHVSIINTMEYALYVEEGHLQEKRWVPGKWEGDVFVYEKGAKTGMMLQTKWIPGQFMARISINKIASEIPTRYKRELEKFLEMGGLK